MDDNAPALAYIISQTRDNIALLVNLKQVSSQDADAFLSRLPASRQTPVSTILFKAKAKWGYNEDEKNAGDLPFSANDIVDVIEETNTDWWRGRFRGREGLFPASYVEKFTGDPTTRPVPAPPTSRYYSDAPPTPGFQNGPMQPSSSPYIYPQPPYPQQHPPPQPSYYPPNPPPQPGPYSPYGGPPPHMQGPPPIMISNNEEHGKKNGIFGGSLGNTLAHSAVGGAGFGAGSALAGGLVNSLF